MDAFETARQNFLANVNEEEKALLESSVGPDDLLADIQGLNQDHEEQSILRRFMVKMGPSFRGLEQYSRAMDVLSTAKPEVLGLLWGGARIVLRLALDFLDTYEKLVDMLVRIGRHLGTFEAYSRLYPHSERLKDSLLVSYEAFLRFCLTCRGKLNEAHSHRSKLYKSSSVRMLAKSLWKPVKRDFELTVRQLEAAIDDVKDEASLAEKEAASQDRNRAVAQDRVNEHQALFEWLDPVQPLINYEKAAKLHEEHTGQWIFTNPAFETWLDTPSGVLWLHAKPGAGKTIMASTVITYLDDPVQLSGNDSIVLYYFCDYKDPKTQSTRKVIETLLADLCRQSSKALAFMADLSRRYREVRSSCSFVDLFEAFLKCLAMENRIFAVVDALDECNDRVELIARLLSATRTVPSLGLLMTSREEHDIQESMEGVPHLSLGASDMADDIETYVTNELQRLLGSRKLKLRDPSLEERIRTTLTSKAGGMFQWVKCQFDVLCSCISDKKIHDCLDRVPAGLDETYIRILTRLRRDHSGDVDMVRKMFLWLVHSLRPLNLIELAEAITLDQSQDRMDFSAIATDPADVLRFSGGLVTTTGNDNIVGLAHFSIKEFLLSDRIQTSPVHDFYAGASEVQLELTRICLNYLMMNDFREGQCHSSNQLVSRTSTYSFLSYSAHYWVKHYHNLLGSHSESLHHLLLKFFTAPVYAQNMLAWQQIEECGEGLLELTLVSAESEVFNAARYGMTGLVKAMCDLGYNVNERSCNDYEYPILIAACHEQHGPSMIAALRDAGADINVRNLRGNVASNGLLHQPDNWGFLQDLIRQGLEVEFLLNSIAGHPSDSTQMVVFLLDNGADIDYSYGDGSLSGTALQLACWKGNLNVTRLLLDRGAEKDVRSGDLGTPLHAAILGKHEDIVSLLLERGVDVDIEGGVLGSPLQAAAWNGDQSLVLRLLQIGSDVNNASGYYGSALAAAIAQRKSEVIELLFNYDAVPNPDHKSRRSKRSEFQPVWGYEVQRVVGNFGQNYIYHTHQPIIWAIEQDDIELVRTLVERGADLIATQKRCRASLEIEYDRLDDVIHPFCCAMQLGFVTIAEYLRSRGADPCRGSFCAMVAVAKRGNIQTWRHLLYDLPSKTNSISISILIDAMNVCKDEATMRSLMDKIDDTEISLSVDLIEPLMNGAVAKNLRLTVSWLLEKGVSPNLRTVNGRHVLFYAIKNRYFDIAKDLIISGANLNFCDDDGGTPLLAAFEVVNIDLMRELLRRGAEIDVSLCRYPRTSYEPGYLCFELVHHVAAAGDIDVMNLLLEYHADLMVQCEICETALWRAVKNEEVNMISLLVQKGAKFNQCNTYGKPILRWAEEKHLVSACKKLTSLGAVRHQKDPGGTINQSVRRLCKELSTNSKTDGCPEWLSRRRWIMLGRCLFLGGDRKNAMIALEQTMKFEQASEYEPEKGNYMQSQIDCEKCAELPSGRFHLCKDDDIMGICEDICLRAHERELQAEGKLETHESLTYPGPWFSSAIPEDHVALSEGQYIPREAWLESLKDWTVTEEAAASLPYREGSNV